MESNGAYKVAVRSDLRENDNFMAQMKVDDFSARVARALVHFSLILSNLAT